MNEQDYLDERALFWGDLLMGMVIVGAVTCGFVVGAWAAITSVLGAVT